MYKESDADCEAATVELVCEEKISILSVPDFTDDLSTLDLNVQRMQASH